MVDADQICGHKGVLPHNPAHKELAVAAVAGLEERPHEDPELAKLGLKQYKFCVVEHRAKSKKMQGLELKESAAEVDTEDFNAMRLAVSGGPKQVMIGTKKDKEALKDKENEKDGESKKGEEEPLANQYKTAYKKAKAALSAVSSELSGLEVVEGKLAEVVGNDKMKVAYKEQLKNARQDALKRFKACPGKADSGDTANSEKDLEKVKGLTEECVAELKKVKRATSAIKKWVENAWACCKQHRCLKAGLQKAYLDSSLTMALAPFDSRPWAERTKKMQLTKPCACWLSCIPLAFDCWFDSCFLTAAVWLSVPQNQSGFKASALACLKKAWSFYTTWHCGCLLLLACIAHGPCPKENVKMNPQKNGGIGASTWPQAAKCQQHWRKWT